MEMKKTERKDVERTGKGFGNRFTGNSGEKRPRKTPRFLG